MITGTQARGDPFVLRVAAALALAAGAGSAGEPAARRILEATGIHGGLIVHLGCGDGTLTAALCVNDRFVVHGLDADASQVAKARAHIRSRGLYGKVSVEQWTSPRLPFASNLVNLVVAERLGGVPMAEVMRVLCPRGAAYIKQSGKWAKKVKPWPSSMDEWTHWRHGPDGNLVSKDRLVGPPRHVRWVAGPLWQRHHGTVPSITTMVSAKGRVFYIADEPPMGLSGLPERWSLLARDAFNGVLLWTRPIADWGSEAWSYWSQGHSARFNHPIHIRKRLVAVGDRVYVTLGFNAPLTALDAATGKTVMTYEGTLYTDELVHHRGTLYLSVNDRPQKPWPGVGVEPAPSRKEEPSQKHVWAVDAATGKVLWKSQPFMGNAAKADRLGSMRHLCLTVADEGVFLVDERHVVCLEPHSGRPRWRAPRLFLLEQPTKPYSRAYFYHGLNDVNLHTVVCYRGVLLVAHPRNQSGWGWRTPMIVQALSPRTGQELWRYETQPITCLDPPDVLGIGGLVWLPDGKRRALVGLEPATGRERRALSIKKALNVGHHHRCYRNKATEQYVVIGRRGAEFVDLRSGEITLHHWARGACRYGHLLANGLFYRPPDHCQCYMAMQPRGFYAMASEEAARRSQSSLAKGHVLQRGPAYGAIEPGSAAAAGAEWPTYRHDPMRSASIAQAVPLPLRVAWATDLGRGLTSPVVAGGRVYCCLPDRHEVHALDAATGKRRWSYTAGSRVDSPPTVHEGRALFGSADGWVYCLRASDGELAWRFRAAPGERRVVAFAQVESAWPVSGSVLVAGGVAFCVAGRSSLLDGGIVACALDAKTGKLLERKGIHEIQTDTRTTGKLPVGALQDVLATDGKSVYLRRCKLGFSTPVRLRPAERPGQRPAHVVADGGFLDDQWFHRAYWSLGGVRGNLIVFDGRLAYAATARNPNVSPNYAFYVPAGGRRDRLIGGQAGKDPRWLAQVSVRAGGYRLVAAQYGPARQARRRRQAVRTPKTRWSLDRFPICPRAMVVAGPTLFVAGFRDRVDPKDPWAAIEGRRGGVLCALGAEDGGKLAELALGAPPVWDGMAAAGGRLYLCTTDGKVLCLRPDR